MNLFPAERAFDHLVLSLVEGEDAGGAEGMATGGGGWLFFWLG